MQSNPEVEASPPIEVCSHREELMERIAERFVALAAHAIDDSGGFRAALSGGATPLPLYRLLATPAYAQRIEWPRIHVFFADERCVPPHHADSNFRRLEETLFRAVPIPPAQIHRMRGEDEPRAAAAAYEALLRSTFPAPSGAPPSRSFDLTLLGMGDDGHTASLFPDAAALSETSRWVVPTRAPAAAHERLTLTLPVLNAAEAVWFLVCGERKAPVVAQAVAGGPDARLPASLVRPARGRARWFIDAGAAAHLPT